jgi:catechol 2,3-dioxygenase-like lactoylglutathione lyase family enzyme
MAGLKRIAPAFPVRDVRVALAYYQRLGFTTREYTGAVYGFAVMDGVEIQVGKATAPATAYLYVEDADSLARTWASTGGDIRFPEDTEWGQREGVLIDPDGNIIRFGSPLPG